MTETNGNGAGGDSGRVTALRERLRARLLEHHLQLMESTLFFGSGGNLVRKVTEDPRTDDGEVWDETGFRAGLQGGGGLRPRSEDDLAQGRRMGRSLAQNNGYAIGGHEARVSYVVGTGVQWQAVAREGVEPGPGVVAAANEVLSQFRRTNQWCAVEQEAVRRADRDGEYLLRLFPSASGPLRVRFAEPEDVVSPPGDQRVIMGVEVAPGDVRSVLAYWIRPHREEAPVRVPAWSEVPGIPNVVHGKINVDLNSRRGWPTFWAIRRNLVRAERLLRNGSNTAQIQSSIALIREHENATKSEVESFVKAAQDALLVSTLTQKETSLEGSYWGTVIDKGPGYSYKAPISSVNAAEWVALIRVELREAAARLQMPEFLFSADASNNNFASSLVAESPAVRNFQRLQAAFVESFTTVVEAALIHAARKGRLPPDVLRQVEVQGTPPAIEVRNRLEEAQTNQILSDNDLLSRTTWQMRADLDPDEEERNKEAEARERQARAQASMAAMPPAMRQSQESPAEGDRDQE